jgi:hypothetical protein
MAVWRTAATKPFPDVVCSSSLFANSAMVGLQSSLSRLVEGVVPFGENWLARSSSYKSAVCTA